MNHAFFSNRLFEGISADILRSITIQEVEHAPETLIFREGSPGATVMLVGKGRVQISKIGRKEKQEVLSVLEANDFFGELAVIDHGPRSATAMALNRSLIGEIDRPALDLHRRPQSWERRATALRSCARWQAPPTPG